MVAPRMAWSASALRGRPGPRLAPGSMVDCSTAPILSRPAQQQRDDLKGPHVDTYGMLVVDGGVQRPLQEVGRDGIGKATGVAEPPGRIQHDGGPSSPAFVQAHDQRVLAVGPVPRLYHH